MPAVIKRDLELALWDIVAVDYDGLWQLPRPLVIP